MDLNQAMRHRFRFSLRTLLIVTGFLCVALGWIARERSQSWKEQALATQLEKDGWYVTVRGPFDVWDWKDPHAERNWWCRFTQQILGDRIISVQKTDTADCNLRSLAGLERVQHISVERTNVKDLKPLAEFFNLRSLCVAVSQVEDLSPLAGLANLTDLNLELTKVTELTPLTSLTNLQSLDVSYTKVNDLSPLASLTNLQFLNVTGAKVRSLTPIFPLKQLSRVWANHTDASKENTDLLQRAVPNCKIYAHSLVD